ISKTPRAGNGGSPIFAASNGSRAIGIPLIVPPIVLLNMNRTHSIRVGFVKLEVFADEPSEILNGIGSIIVLIVNPINAFDTWTADPCALNTTWLLKLSSPGDTKPNPSPTILIS